MGHHRHSRSEILAKLGPIQVDLATGMAMDQVCAKHGVTLQTLQRWLREHPGARQEGIPRLKQLESENRRLRKAVAELETDKKVLSEAIRGNF